MVFVIFNILDVDRILAMDIIDLSNEKGQIDMKTKQELVAIIAEAKEAAKVAAEAYMADKMGGQDAGACGFAWINIYSLDGVKLKGNTKLGKLLKECGVGQDWQRVFHIWNPSGLGVQNVDIKEAGAMAAAEVFTSHGFKAYAGSRLD